MKLLLIAYEFAPIPSAQSIRWHHLAGELARRGWEVDVLSVDLAVDAATALPVPGGVRVHRSFAGPFIGGASALNRRLAKPQPAASAVAPPAAVPVPERLYRGLRGALDALVFPDARREWQPFAQSRLQALARERRWDCIVASHEPAVDLLVAARAGRELGLPVIADLGDPVVTDYSPRWRRGADLRREGRILRGFGRIVTTSLDASRLLAARHGLDPGRLSVVPQGTVLEVPVPPSPACRALIERLRGSFTLLYTGNFYAAFRNPAEIIRALAGMAGVRLLVVGSQQAAGLAAPNVEHVARLSHFDCLHLQRACPVLLSLGNRQAEQTPGKLAEYLGACRPVLHVFQQPDPGREVVERLRRGLAVPDEAGAIRAAIAQLAGRFAEGRLDEGFELGAAAVCDLTWPHLAKAYAGIIGSVVAGPGLSAPPATAPGRAHDET